MSFSPESFDRLLAEKLAQAAPPAYEPAHWDQLEDQLQHLNQALQQQAPAQAPAAPMAAPLAGKLATLGVTALLTGLTAVNGYFFYAAAVAREEGGATPAREVPLAQPTPAAVPVFTAPVPAAPTNEPTRIGAGAAAPAVTLRVARSPEPTPTTASAAGEEIVVSSVGEAVYEQMPTIAAPSTAAPVTQAAPVAEGPRVASTLADSASQTAPAVAAPTPMRALSQAVFNVITPNGDGLNDRFELPLPAGACRLKIYDRANRVVFSAERYDNAWDGGTLPAGQYLYIIETTGAATWSTTGPLTIVR